MQALKILRFNFLSVFLCGQCLFASPDESTQPDVLNSVKQSLLSKIYVLDSVVKVASRSATEATSEINLELAIEIANASEESADVLWDRGDFAVQKAFGVSTLNVAENFIQNCGEGAEHWFSSLNQELFPFHQIALARTQIAATLAGQNAKMQGSDIALSSTLAAFRAAIKEFSEIESLVKDKNLVPVAISTKTISSSIHELLRIDQQKMLTTMPEIRDLVLLSLKEIISEMILLLDDQGEDAHTLNLEFEQVFETLASEQLKQYIDDGSFIVVNNHYETEDYPSALIWAQERY